MAFDATRNEKGAAVMQPRKTCPVRTRRITTCFAGVCHFRGHRRRNMARQFATDEIDKANQRERNDG